MIVYVATWGVRNAGTGLDVFASRGKALNEVEAWISELDLNPGEHAEACKTLNETGSVWIERLESGYAVEQHEVLE